LWQNPPAWSPACAIAALLHPQPIEEGDSSQKWATICRAHRQCHLIQCAFTDQLQTSHTYSIWLKITMWLKIKAPWISTRN
jgi:hypothetical protein